MIFNSLLNNISEHFSLGHLAYDLDCPVKTEWYIFGITYARHPEIPFRKLRVFLMKENSLLDMNENDKEPEYESSKHTFTFQGFICFFLKKSHQIHELYGEEISWIFD
jgi:hypothetical protein